MKGSKWEGVIKPKGQNADASKGQVIGRPRGKRSDPNYRQVSAWIRRDTYNEVTKRLIDEDRREFSDLVQTLLADWLQAGQKQKHTA